MVVGVRVLVMLRLLMVVMSRRWKAHGSYGDGRIRRDLEERNKETRLGYVRAREGSTLNQGFGFGFLSDLFHTI